MKKFLFMLCLLMGYATLHADTATVDGITWTYQISNGETRIYNNDSLAISSSTSGAITIPSTLGGYPVTSIGDWAFKSCSRLTSVTIPSSVTSIGSDAFRYCSSLTSVTIPSSVTSIGDDAFYGCSSLTSVTIPLSVTSIGEGAFHGCSSLTSVTIPSSVTTIGNSAFRFCSGLTSVMIPSSVTEIGDGAFYYCASLTSVTIPEGVISIGGWAFHGCSSLTSVTISSSVTSIGESAFSGCSNLTSVTIPEGVTSIGSYPFSRCSSLTSFVVANENQNYTAINGLLCSKDGKTLITCPGGLTSLTIPSSVTSIGDHAFSYCSGLTSVTILEGVTSIGRSAFSYCSGLTSVTIPSSVTEIGGHAFEGCDSLTSVYFRGAPPTVGSGVFDDVTAKGYYPQQYADAWQKVIDENGMWSGLQMESYLLNSEGEDNPGSSNTPVGPSNPSSPELSTCPTYSMPVPYCAATFTATAVSEEQVTLKLAAKKGYIFAGWHKDEAFTESCDSTLADYRNSTYTYNVGPDNTNFNARFVTVDEDMKLDLIEPKNVSLEGNEQYAIQLKIDSYSLPKVSVKGLPAGMMFTDKPVMEKGSKTEVEYPANTIYGTPTKPGIYTVKVALTNTTITKAITKTFNIEVPNLKAPGIIDVYNYYGEYVPGVSYVEEVPEAEGCTVTGLPAGMKWTAKDIVDLKTKEVTVPANSVYGVPTTPGNYTVYFTKTVDKVKHTATATFKVGPYPQLNVMVSDGGVGGKVAGIGAYAANKKVTLKATPNKGYVFAGWYKDGVPCDSTLVDYRNPSYTYVMGEEDTQFYAQFVTKDDEANYEMGIELIDEYYNSLGDDVQVRAGEVMEPVKVWVDSLTLPTVTVTGLPTGLKFDAKTFTLSGKPTKPGFYPISIEAKNASKSRSAFAIVNLEVRHFDAHGLHGDWEDAEPIVIDAFTTERFDLEDWFGGFFEDIPIKSLKLPAGLTYNAKTGTINGNGKLKSGSHTVTLTDKAGQVTTFTLVAELSEADMFDYNNYLPLNPRQGAVQGVNTGLGWMTIFSATDDARFFSDAEIAKAISVTVSGLPSGLKAELYKTPAGPQLYVCDLFLVGKTSVAPGDYPVTVTISNSRTGQVEYVSSWIRIYPPPSIHINQELTFTAHDFYDKNGEPREAHAEVYHTINGTSGTATYTMTIEPPIGQSTAKPILKSGTLPIDYVVVDEYSSTGLLSYHYRYTKTPRITPEIDIWLETDDGVTFKVVSGIFYESEGRNYFGLDEQWIHHPID